MAYKEIKKRTRYRRKTNERKGGKVNPLYPLKLRWRWIWKLYMHVSSDSVDIISGFYKSTNVSRVHDDVIKWKHFPRNWPFVRGIHRSPVKSPRKGKWRGALMFSLISVWINGWVNNGEAGDLRRYRAHYDVTVMISMWCFLTTKSSHAISTRLGPARILVYIITTLSNLMNDSTVVLLRHLSNLTIG